MHISFIKFYMSIIFHNTLNKWIEIWYFTWSLRWNEKWKWKLWNNEKSGWLSLKTSFNLTSPFAFEILLTFFVTCLFLNLGKVFLPLQAYLRRPVRGQDQSIGKGFSFWCKKIFFKEEKNNFETCNFELPSLLF